MLSLLQIFENSKCTVTIGNDNGVVVSGGTIAKNNVHVVCQFVLLYAPRVDCYAAITSVWFELLQLLSWCVDVFSNVP
jgi:hypothetical protein